MKKMTIMAIIAMAVVSVSGAFASRSVSCTGNAVATDSTETTETAAPAVPAADTVVVDTAAVAK